MPAARRPVVGLVIRALVLGALLLVAGRALGPLPAPAPFLDPTHGIWAVARTAELPATARGTIPGLRDSVAVAYDDRAVPHIFARNTEDAWRALGYVVARDRLFQLELQTRAAAGRLTEVAGPRALPLDREMRELGIPRAAEAKWAARDTGAPATRAIEAYAAGVNAWIAQLAPRDLPFEFRLLGARPSRWEPVHSVLLLHRMGWTLALSDEEGVRARAAALVGAEAADALFPEHEPVQEPIEPAGAGGPVVSRVPIPPPAAPALAARHGTHAAHDARRPTHDERPDLPGSNNWAVAPARSASGHALLAGDPHLTLSLPSIWYEAHVVVADTLDVYGVTIPGSPAIIIGFNRDVAWTFTNTGADVMDRYVETVDDSASPARYRLDGAWHPLELRIETYRDADGRVLATDTVRYTHRGPMTRADGQWRSTRWTVLEASDENAALLAAARATSARGLLEATARWLAPAQNILAADRGGTIAIRSTGRYPVRPGDGRGDVARDGATRASDWTGAWAVDEYPQAVDPAQGFLASANQEPRAPRPGGRYLGAQWPAPWRALRINALLRADSAVTPEAMRRWQTDPGSERARAFLPALVAAGAAAGDPQARRAGELLAAWDGRYTLDNRGAVLFEAVMRELARRLWDELRDADGAGVTPSASFIRLLLDEPASPWWDDRRTDAREERDALLATALAAGLDSTVARHGAPGDPRWEWRRAGALTIRHLLQLPALGEAGIPVQGGPGTLNPSSGRSSFGASWRMVVELGPEVRAWGTYPGGQSGHPASRRYLDRLATWASGALDTLRVPRRAADLGDAQVSAQLVLVP